MEEGVEGGKEGGKEGGREVLDCWVIPNIVYVFYKLIHPYLTAIKEGTRDSEEGKEEGQEEGKEEG
jgi:hypothetical protein